MRAAIALFSALLACSGGSAPAPTPSPPPPAPQPPPGELWLMFGPQPDDRIVVHADGTFDLVTAERVSMAGCGGVCPRRVDHYTVVGESVREPRRVLLERTPDGHLAPQLAGEIAIEDDGTLVQGGQRLALTPSNTLPRFLGVADVTVAGATTPALRRRAMLVLVFFEYAAIGGALSTGAI